MEGAITLVAMHVALQKNTIHDCLVRNHFVQKKLKRHSPGEDRTPDLRISHTAYKYDALTD